MNAKKAVPSSVVRRLTKYYAVIQDVRREGMEWISSSEIAAALGLTSSTVRQDLSHLDFAGVSKRGYETSGLERVLADVLGATTTWNVAVIGAGNLGRALAMHEEFGRHGFAILGIFDSDKAKVGKRVGSLVVSTMEELPRFVRSRKIDVGIIAVPSQAAQQVADQLVTSGVRGLLNMALMHVVAPGDVRVVDARVVASLQELTHALKQGG